MINSKDKIVKKNYCILLHIYDSLVRVVDRKFCSQFVRKYIKVDYSVYNRAKIGTERHGFTARN